MSFCQFRLPFVIVSGVPIQQSPRFHDIGDRNLGVIDILFAITVPFGFPLIEVKLQIFGFEDVDGLQFYVMVYEVNPNVWTAFGVG